MNENFEKFKAQMSKKPSEIPLQQVKPVEKTNEREKDKRYPGTRQLNVDLDEDMFIELKLKSAKERKPVRTLVKQAIALLLGKDQSLH